MAVLETTAQARLLRQLRDDWVSKGPALCIVEGFTGVGKSTVATRLVEETTLPAIYARVPAIDASLDDVMLAFATELESIGSSTLADALSGDMLSALINVLREPVLIVLDDFHNWLTPTGELIDAIQPLFIDVLQRSRLKGRFLVVADQALKEESLPGSFDLHRLPPLEQDEASSLLHLLLHSRRLEDEIPERLRDEVTRWLGGNIHALKILVGCLKHDSLDELIKLEPKVWDARGTRVTPELLRPLHDAILARTLKHLSLSTPRALQSLSVYRHPFQIEALDQLGLPPNDRRQVRDELYSSFLLERRKNWFNLNPIAREVGLARLHEDTERTRRAHLLAGNYYDRHFRARRPVSLGKYGPQFVEARYHLWRAGDERRVQALVTKYRDHLTAAYSRDPSIPRDPDLLDENISVLMAVLSDGGPARLRYHLARMLNRRDHPDDKLRALRQTREAIRETGRWSTNPEIWSLHIRLTYEVEGPESGADTARRALQQLRPNWTLYYLAANKLAEHGSVSEAIKLSEEGVQKLGLQGWYLVQLICVFLSRQGNYKAAIERHLDWLQDTSASDASARRLFEQACLLAIAISDDESLHRLQSLAYGTVGWEQQRAYVDVLESELQGEWAYAAWSASLFLTKGIYYPALARREVFDWLCAGDIESAAIAFTPSDTIDSHWLAAIFAYKSGRRREYHAAIQRCIGRELSEAESRNPLLWLQVWDERPETIAYHYPHLPKELTGLGRDVVRLMHGPRVIQDGVGMNTVESNSEVTSMPSAGSGPKGLPKKPVKVFYSYSHEDERHRRELEKALASLRRTGAIEEWHDRKITAGADWNQAIDTNLEEADIILLMISRDFMNSDYCNDVEVKRAMQKHREGRARVVPIIVRPADWRYEEFAQLLALPTDGRAVVSWPNEDEAWVDISNGLRQLISSLR